MAKPEIPNGETWATHQHVIMAINIKSMNDFEPADGATPVFYGSKAPFTITEHVVSGQPISITGTEVKTYITRNNINNSTPILLVTRVRDIEPNKLTDLDKKYIVSSNVAFDANTITATIADKLTTNWNSLPKLIEIDIDKYKNIFDRDNVRRKNLIAKATTALLKYHNQEGRIATAHKLAHEEAMKQGEPALNKRSKLTPNAMPKTEADCKKLNPRERNQCLAHLQKLQTEEALAHAKAKRAEEDRIKHEKTEKQHRNEEEGITSRQIKGGTIKDDLTNLNDIISKKDINFKKYVYFVLMQPFYFKLNALTPTMLEKIKNYNLSGGGSTGTFETHILQPFLKFSYVKYIDIDANTDLVTHLSSFIEHPEQSNIVSNFAGQIEKDTKNYNEITDSENAESEKTGYYIHIFRFIELIEKMLNRYPTVVASLPEKVTNFIKYALENIHIHMMRVNPLFDLLTSVDNILISDIQQTPKIEKPLQVYIDDYVSSQTRTDVITYLKITNTEPAELSDNHSWNQRYDIRLKQSYLAGSSNFKLNAMTLGYKTDPIPLYEQITDARGVKRIAAVDGLDELVTYRTAKVEYNEIDSVKTYDKYYLFGNYENIFPLYKIDGAKETNLENAQNMTAIIEQICTYKKPVFLLGYGASGSGKTSSLIYFNKGKTPDEQNGIVIHLCKEIIAKLNVQNTQVTSVKVVVKEFYMTNDLQTNTSAEYIFDTNLMKTKTIGDVGKLKHAYHVNMNKPVEEFKTMGQVLKLLVDVDRYVKATTNNPQSSRSHVLVFIQFCSDDEGRDSIRNLIIGDFAGKENAFQCTDTDTIVSFLNTKIENPESKYQGYPFYSAQIKGGAGNYENDPTDKIQTQSGTINTRKYISSSVANHVVYNFEKPFESGHFIKTDTIKNQEQEEKYIISAMKYQLKRLIKIDENANNIIYARLLNVDGPLYTQLLRPDKLAQGQKSHSIEQQSVPSMHPGIGLIDKYSLVRSTSVDKAAVDIMIRNMCTDFSSANNKNGKLSCEDVSLLSYFTNYYLQDNSHNKAVIDSLILCINKFTDITIPVIDVEKKGFSNVYQLILRMCYYLYVYNWKAGRKDNQYIEKYITDVVSVLNAPIDDKIGQSKDLSMKVYEMNKNLIESLNIDSGKTYEYVYTIDDAIKIIQEIYSMVSVTVGFIPFKYYQVGEIILDSDNRPGRIKTVLFLDYESYIENSFPIRYDVIPINQSVISQNIDRVSGKLIPSGGFPVLAGEENGDIQMMKQLILEELFEVESCNFTQPEFTMLHLGLELKKETEDKMTRIGRAGNTFTYRPISKKKNINDYQFVDAEYSSIIQRSKPTGEHITKPRDYDTFFVSTVNNMIKYIKKPTNRDIFQTTYTSPFLCSQITDDVIAQLLTIFPNDDTTIVDGTKYSIVVTHPDKIPYYADKFANNTQKPIPIVKTFTIAALSEHIMETRFDFLFPFFEIKGLPYCQQKKDGSYMHNYVREFRYILDSLHVGFDDNLSPIIDDMHKYMVYINQSRNIITETMVRLKHGKQVCENRLIEGKYINSSLDQIRAAFKYILNKKHENSDALFHSPDFIDICLQSYCPSGMNCFNTSSTGNAPESLINEIYNHIYTTDDANAKIQFYKDLAISVFGVFNVSRLADNPPPVPYIDINHLKQIYYNTDSDYSQNYPILWALHELKLQIDDLKLKHNPLFYEGLKTLIKSAADDYKTDPTTGVLTISRTGISKGFMANLKKMIEAIDIHNAASTIGTLEFLDQLSKFNSVNNLCYKNEGIDTTPYLDDSEYEKYTTQNKWQESNIHM